MSIRRRSASTSRAVARIAPAATGPEHGLHVILDPAREILYSSGRVGGDDQ
jgi:hypothetical protein